MRYKLPISRRRQENFVQKWRKKIIAATRSYWKKQVELLDDRTISALLSDGPSAEFIDSMKAVSTNFAKNELKPLLHTMVDEQGIMIATDIRRATSKGLVEWLMSKASTFDAASESVIEYLDTEAEYWAVTDSVAAINRLRDILVTYYGKNYSLKAVRDEIRAVFPLLPRAARSVRRLFDDLLSEGVPESKALAEMERYARNLRNLRAETIARTEATRAYNFANLEAVSQAEGMGLISDVVKVWSAVGDDRTRDSHVEMDGESVGENEQFSNGLMYPGDQSGDPAETINCRCTMLFEVEK